MGNASKILPDLYTVASVSLSISVIAGCIEYCLLIGDGADPTKWLGVEGLDFIAEVMMGVVLLMIDLSECASKFPDIIKVVAWATTVVAAGFNISASTDDWQRFRKSGLHGQDAQSGHAQSGGPVMLGHQLTNIDFGSCNALPVSLPHAPTCPKWWSSDYGPSILHRLILGHAMLFLCQMR